jgi:protein-disulfide isomerase
MDTQTTQQPLPETKKQGLSLPAAIITGAAIIAVGLVVAFGPKTAPKQDDQQGYAPAPEITKEVLTVRANDRIRGDISTAQIAVIEYSDSDCPFCERFHATMEQIMTDYNGKVAWVYRYFPLSIHPNATTEAVALECVGSLGGNSAFASYLDKLMTVTLNPDPQSNKALTTYAGDAGVDKKLFESCMKGTTASDRVAADSKEAQSIGAQGTPFSIIVNLKTGTYDVVAGAYPIADVKAKIDALLK